MFFKHALVFRYFSGAKRLRFQKRRNYDSKGEEITFPETKELPAKYIEPDI